MCFNVHSKHSEEMIANKNISCYKVMICYSWANQYGKGFKAISLYQKHEYKLNVKYKLYNSIVKREYAFIEGYYINEGFHSYSSLEQAKSWLNSNDFESDIYVVKCIIPKGSKYYYDPSSEEYVSDQIIIKHKLK